MIILILIFQEFIYCALYYGVKKKDDFVEKNIKGSRMKNCFKNGLKSLKIASFSVIKSKHFCCRPIGVLGKK